MYATLKDYKIDFGTKLLMLLSTTLELDRKTTFLLNWVLAVPPSLLLSSPL